MTPKRNRFCPHFRNLCAGLSEHAYHFLWHFVERLEPLFTKQDAGTKSGKSPKKREWTLESVRSVVVRVGEAEFQQITEQNAD